MVVPSVLLQHLKILKYVCYANYILLCVINIMSCLGVYVCVYVSYFMLLRLNTMTKTTYRMKEHIEGSSRRVKAPSPVQ